MSGFVVVILRLLQKKQKQKNRQCRNKTKIAFPGLREIKIPSGPQNQANSDHKCPTRTDYSGNNHCKFAKDIVHTLNAADRYSAARYFGLSPVSLALSFA